ncbi:MAG: hypothetical protein JETT_1880 [Candidatus Jettenia ecosi]|uniref:Uncharacterized protein n=1 Tax=Candidatus Jettenia ecosi TaxID=2494326 RepID=A0A533QAX7_9BACT|nr:MAG: hypothetical protein JETT_1880 [Candidatus Jettenia ecosi]
MLYHKYNASGCLAIKDFIQNIIFIICSWQCDYYRMASLCQAQISDQEKSNRSISLIEFY